MEFTINISFTLKMHHTVFEKYWPFSFKKKIKIVQLLMHNQSHMQQKTTDENQLNRSHVVSDSSDHFRKAKEDLKDFSTHSLKRLQDILKSDLFSNREGTS